MLYTLFVLFGGIYVGQEFDNLPSLRVVVENIMIYLSNM